MKTLIIINEPFEKMVLGKNTTLAYILAAFELGHETCIVNLPKSGEGIVRDVNRSIMARKIGKKEGKILANNYKVINQDIIKYVDAKDYAQLRTMPLIEVQDVAEHKDLELVPLNEIGLVLQRTEPMKAPFPPEGNKNVDVILQKIRDIFPMNMVFNCPVGLGDKEVPQEMNRILQARREERIAIPTAEFKLKERNFTDAFELMGEEYQKLYGDNERKLVVKPKNSAQTLGVFAVQMSPEGWNLKTVKSQKIATLADLQIYKIHDGLEQKEFKAVIEILCFIQRVRSERDAFYRFDHKKINEISRGEIAEKAKELYNEEVLVQPFLEGVKSGDVRLNYLKNKEGDFYLAGSVFRSSLREKSSGDFTTAYISGGATSKPLSSLFAAEEEDLLEKSEVILDILNKDLRDQYKGSMELGADFILVGDDKTALLGEINHHCQGLIPVSEAMEKASDLHAVYDGGLALVKKAIQDNLVLQKK